jgi:hypothetical protein
VRAASEVQFSDEHLLAMCEDVDDMEVKYGELHRRIEACEWEGDALVDRRAELAEMKETLTIMLYAIASQVSRLVQELAAERRSSRP